MQRLLCVAQGGLLYILDTIFPPSSDHLVVRCTKSLVSNMTVEEVYITKQVVPIIRLLEFSKIEVCAAVHEAKFFGSKKAAELLGEVLSTYLREYIGRVVGEEEVILIPVPLSAKRFRERGYNQVTVVLKNAQSRLTGNVLIKNTWIYRRRHTTPQTGLGRSARLKNMRAAFAFRGRAKEEIQKYITRGAKVIVVDDVTTTGATLHEIAKLFKKEFKVNIICIALSH